MARKIVLILLLCSSVAFAKYRDWHDAVVTGMETRRGGAAAAPVGTMIIAVPIVFVHYMVETDSLRMDLFCRKTLNVTINKKTHVAVDGENAYLLDDSGREKKLRVAWKAAK